MDESRLLPLMARVTLRDFALLTYSVPAERVRPHVPENYELETHFDHEGRARAWISFAYFHNHRMRWTLSSLPALTFHQCTFRTYIRYRGRPALYFFATYLGTEASFLLERAVALDAYRASFDVRATRSPTGYERMTAQISNSFARASFELRAMELPRSDEETQFFTYRLHGLLKSSAGFQLDQIVRHRRFRPWQGELRSAKIELFERMGLLYPDEALRPQCVYLQPEIEFFFYPPVPALIVPALQGRMLESYSRHEKGRKAA